MMRVRQCIKYCMSDIFMTEPCSLIWRGDHTCFGDFNRNEISETHKNKVFSFLSSGPMFP
jgi:hypothetical protein